MQVQFCFNYKNFKILYMIHNLFSLGSSIISMNISFMILQGVPFDEDTTDGRKCKTTVTMEGDNKIITSQKAQKSGQKDVTVIREFSDKGIHVQMICEDVTSVQFFDRT